MSGHIFIIGFSYGNERGSKKDKKVKKGKKPEIPAFLPFFTFLSFLLPSRLSLQDLTLWMCPDIRDSAQNSSVLANRSILNWRRL